MTEQMEIPQIVILNDNQKLSGGRGGTIHIPNSQNILHDISQASQIMENNYMNTESEELLKNKQETNNLKQESGGPNFQQESVLPPISQPNQKIKQTTVLPSHSTNNQYIQITPGYQKFVIDEANANYDYVKGMFTDEQIKEAFHTLDYDKDGAITSSDLAFFLDFIGEKATSEEIEEMVQMCDLDGNGQVSIEEFTKLASGQSLAPIGQSHPPTAEMVRNRIMIEKIMKNEAMIEEENKQRNINMYESNVEPNTQNDVTNAENSKMKNSSLTNKQNQPPINSPMGNQKNQ